jgi:hypothetical protein
MIMITWLYDTNQFYIVIVKALFIYLPVLRMSSEC